MRPLQQRRAGSLHQPELRGRLALGDGPGADALEDLPDPRAPWSGPTGFLVPARRHLFLPAIGARRAPPTPGADRALWVPEGKSRRLARYRRMNEATHPPDLSKRRRQGPRHQLLLDLYARGPYALTRGLVELADGEGPLEPFPWRVLRRIRLAAAGRAHLGVPAPAPLGDRAPMDVLRDAVARFLGTEPELTADPTGELLCLTVSTNDDETWEMRMNATVRYASEQGVPCVPIVDNPRGKTFVLVGFAVLSEVSP